MVRFSTDVEALFEKPQQASEGNVKKAVEFVSSLEAIGGTAIDEAMTRALKDGANRGEKPHMVMFITDGHPTVGATRCRDVAARRTVAGAGAGARRGEGGANHLRSGPGAEPDVPRRECESDHIGWRVAPT